MKKKYVAWLLVLAALATWTLYAYLEYTRRNPDLNDLSPAFSKSASQLVEEYGGNELRANSAYLGKVLEVSGILKKVERDPGGFLTLVLGVPGNASSVRCILDSLQTKKASELKPSNSITVKGICTGYNSDELGLGADVLLNRCVLIKP